MLALHFISSSRSVLTEIKAICQQPAEHACIINHVCGFLLYKKKILQNTDQKEKRSSKEKSFSRCRGFDLHTHRKQWAQTNPKSFSCMRYWVGLVCLCVTKKSVWPKTFCAICPLTLKLDMCHSMLYTSESLLFSLRSLSLTSKDKKCVVQPRRVISKDTCRVKWFTSLFPLFLLLLGKKNRANEWEQ